MSTVLAVIGLVLWLAPTLFADLWMYAHDNIDVNAIDISTITGVGAVDIGTIDVGFGIFESVVKQLTVGILFLVFRDAQWVAIWVMRVARFAFLTIMLTTIMYLVIFWIIAQILHSKLRFTAVLISTLFSSAVSFLIVFFFIPNNQQLIEFLAFRVEEFFTSTEPVLDIPLFAIDMLYAFYNSFLIMIVVHLFTTSIITYYFRNY